MFTNLIESASHQKELARKGRFFLAAMVSYALLFMSAGVVSIYAYDAHLGENQNLEMLVLLAPTDAPEAPAVERNTQPKPNANAKDSGVKNIESERTDAIARINDPSKVPDKISSIASKVPEIPLGKFNIGTKNVDGSAMFDKNLPICADCPESSGGSGNLVKAEEIGTPPPSIKRETVKPPPVISKGVINGQAIHKPKPVYPPLAITLRKQGVVSVQILVDEKGKVISARALSGDALLRQAAEQAALQTRFSPTLLSDVPVKVSGTITFNFILNQ
ncbi:MAG: TonB family protein [Pyrinomonadaceae bacterium]|nr:TonB family protein [Pyrinomonadaceae bacterium]